MPRLESKIPQLLDHLKLRASVVIRKTALDVDATAKQSFTGPKTGTQYGDHQASAPGEPPAIDTGTLQNSISVETESALEARVIVGAEYGLYLEMGTVFMEARPFLGPAFDANAENFKKALAQVFE